MKYYFLGFLFVFLDFNLPLGYGGQINLIPAFLGYAILFFTNRRLGHENGHFRRLRITTAIAFILSTAEFALDLIALPLPKVVELVISVVMTIAALYIAYEFAEGAKDLERSLYKKLDADKISSAWIILSMTALLEFLVLYLPDAMLPCYLVHWLAVAWFESATFHFERKLLGKE